MATEYKIYDHNDNMICHDFSALQTTESTIRVIIKSTLQSMKGKYAEYRISGQRKFKTIANF